MVIRKNKKLSKLYVYKDKTVSKVENAFSKSEMIDYGGHIICTVIDKKY